MHPYDILQQCLVVPYFRHGATADYAAVRTGGSLYLYFEDSNGRGDWKRNLDFPAKPYRRQKDGLWFCHRGFLRVWKDLEPVLAPMIADSSVRRIVVAGYSHGAALAVLCHEYIWFHRPDLRGALEGWGFGCPRVLWGPMPQSLYRRWDTFITVRNVPDLVTHLPPSLLGYHHVGTMLEIGAKGRYSPTEAHLAENYLHELQAAGQKTTYSGKRKKAFGNTT